MGGEKSKGGLGFCRTEGGGEGVRKGFYFSQKNGLKKSSGFFNNALKIN